MRAAAQDTIVIGTVGGRNTLEWPLYIAYKNGTPAAETHSGQTQGFAWDQPGHLRSASSWNHYHKPSRANELAAMIAFRLTIRFPNNETLDVRIARTQLLEQLDIEVDES